MTLQGYGLEMNRTTSYIRPTTDGNKTLYVGGVDASLDWASIQFRSLLGLYMTGTKFLDASRNLVNIGTISSGAITSSGTVNAQILSASSEIFLGASSLGKISQSGNNWIFNTWANSQYNERLRITDSGITVSGTTITEGIDTSSHIYIDNDRDINFRKADGTTDGTILTRAGGNATRFKYGGNSFIFDSIENKDWRIYNSSGDFIFSVIPTSNATSSSTRVYGKLQIGTTTVIDNARNLTNINSMYVAGYIYHTGDTDTNIVFSDDTITLNAGGQGTTFKGNGRVGIGVVNPTEKLHVEGNIELQNNGYIGSLDGNYWQRIRFEDNTPSTTKAFNFETRNGSGSFINHMSITNNGDVSINGGTLNLGTADSSSGHINAYENMSFNIDVDNDDSNRYFSFHKNGSSASGSELMRLTEVGQLLIGKTTADNTTAGIRIDGDNKFMSIVRAGNPSLILNRTASDGDILQLRRDGTTIGNIGVDTNDNLVIEGNSTHSGIQFGTETLLPHKNGGLTNRVIDLGNNSYRFKNFHLAEKLISTQVALA